MLKLSPAVPHPQSLQYQQQLWPQVESLHLPFLPYCAYSLVPEPLVLRAEWLWGTP